jgi:hypothetical protein
MSMREVWQKEDSGLTSELDYYLEPEPKMRVLADLGLIVPDEPLRATAVAVADSALPEDEALAFIRRSQHI